MKARTFGYFLASLAAVLATGCATRATSIDAQWVGPTLAGRDKAQNILVVAALRDATQRRMLEDRMVTELGVAGIKATPSYRLLPASAQVSEAQLRSAVADAGASYVLMSSIAGVTTEVRVTQQAMMGPGWGPGWGWHPGMPPGWGSMSSFYSASWNRSITPDVRTTQNVHGDTRLFDARSSEVVWSAATTTVTGWDSIPAMIDQFVTLIASTLKKDAVI